MPFTLAHPAAALPLAAVGLPCAAVVTGSMIPDLPLFLPIGPGYGLTHSLRGVVTVDLVEGAVALLVWVLVLRDALVDVAPARFRVPLPARSRYSARQSLLAVPALVAGSLTHVVWDAFTHPGRGGVVRIGWLHTRHAGLEGAAWAQYASGLVGLVVIALWVRAAGRHPATTRPRPRQVPQLGPRSLLAVVALTVVLGLAAAAAAASSGLHAVLYRGAVAGVVGLAVGLLALAALWQVLARTRTA